VFLKIFLQLSIDDCNFFAKNWLFLGQKISIYSEIRKNVGIFAERSAV
jgi:hypothetical protein